MTKLSPENPSGYAKTGRIKELQEENRVKAEKWEAVMLLAKNSHPETFSYGPGREIEGAAQAELYRIIGGIVEDVEENVHPDTLGSRTWAYDYWKKFVFNFSGGRIK